jgi:hypothetical protein
MREPTNITPLLSVQRIPGNVNFSELIDACKSEIILARKNNPSEERSSIALLLMATKYDDVRAWEGVERCFDHLVRNWLHHHPQKKAALRFKNEQHYVSLTFAAFRHFTTSEDMQFPTLLAALRCLFLCLNGVVQDVLRTQSAREHTLALLMQTTDTITAGELMALVQKLLTSEREQRLAYLLFHCGLQPVEIVRDCPLEFSDLQEVTMLRSAIILRLLNNLDHLQHPS